MLNWWPRNTACISPYFWRWQANDLCLTPIFCVFAFGISRVIAQNATLCCGCQTASMQRWVRSAESISSPVEKYRNPRHTHREGVYKPALVLHVLEGNTEFKLQRFHKRCSQKCAEWKLWNILENRQSPVYKPNFDLRHRLTELFCTRRNKKAKETDTDALLQSHLTSQPFSHYF